MPSKQKSLLCAAVLAAGLAGLTSTPALADAASHSNAQCFYANDWQNWTSPSSSIIYLRVNINDVYRLDLAGGGSSLLGAANTHLVNRVTGSPLICTPVDLELSISDGNGMNAPIIVSAITKLTPDQIAALPKRYRP